MFIVGSDVILHEPVLHGQPVVLGLHHVADGNHARQLAARPSTGKWRMRRVVIKPMTCSTSSSGTPVTSVVRHRLGHLHFSQRPRLRKGGIENVALGDDPHQLLFLRHPTDRRPSEPMRCSTSVCTTSCSVASGEIEWTVLPLTVRMSWSFMTSVSD